jgi:hypothetical protein
VYHLQTFTKCYSEEQFGHIFSVVCCRSYGYLFLLGGSHHNNLLCRSSAGPMQDGMRHFPDQDGRGRKIILQDDGHHPSELHCLIVLPCWTFSSWNVGEPADEKSHLPDVELGW